MNVYGPPETPLPLYQVTSDHKLGMLASFKQFAHALGLVALCVTTFKCYHESRWALIKLFSSLTDYRTVAQ